MTITFHVFKLLVIANGNVACFVNTNLLSIDKIRRNPTFSRRGHCFHRHSRTAQKQTRKRGLRTALCITCFLQTAQVSAIRVCILTQTRSATFTLRDQNRHNFIVHKLRIQQNEISVYPQVDATSRTCGFSRLWNHIQLSTFSGDPRRST